jgi:hypothetical protein
MRIPVAILAGLVLGVAADRFALRQEQAARREALPPAEVGWARARSQSCSSQATPESRVSSPVLESRSKDIRVERPKEEHPLLSEDAENRLTSLLQGQLPGIRKPGQKQNPDGSVDVFGKSEDGKDIYRHFDPKGELTKEGWTDPTGENLHRSFYESGQLKSVSWFRSDRSLTSLGFSQEGLYEYRYDRLVDGTEYDTSYDDAGQVNGVWRRGADGKNVRVE